MHGEHGISGERDNWTAEIQRHVSGGAERAGRPGSHPLQQNWGGLRSPTIDTLFKIAHALDIPPHEIVAAIERALAGELAVVWISAHKSGSRDFPGPRFAHLKLF